MILVSLSIASKNSNGDNRQPFMGPLLQGKKEVGDPLIKRTKFMEEIQTMIQFFIPLKYRYVWGQIGVNTNIHNHIILSNPY